MIVPSLPLHLNLSALLTALVDDADRIFFSWMGATLLDLMAGSPYVKESLEPEVIEVEVDVNEGGKRVDGT